MRYSFRAGRARISSGLQLRTCWGPGPHSPSPQERDMLTAVCCKCWARESASMAYPCWGELKERPLFPSLAILDCSSIRGRRCTGLGLCYYCSVLELAQNQPQALLYDSTELKTWSRNRWVTVGTALIPAWAHIPELCCWVVGASLSGFGAPSQWSGSWNTYTDTESRHFIGCPSIIPFPSNSGRQPLGWKRRKHIHSVI